MYEYTTAIANPGPGHYNDAKAHRVNSKGTYFASKYKNSGCRIIAPARSKRFKGKVKGHGNPGPGSYSKKMTYLNKGGKYFLSKMKNSGAGFFKRDKRNLMGFKASGTPGPGSYRLPSDFGYYEKT